MLIQVEYSNKQFTIWCLWLTKCDKITAFFSFLKYQIHLKETKLPFEKKKTQKTIIQILPTFHFVINSYNLEYIPWTKVYYNSWNNNFACIFI